MSAPPIFKMMARGGEPAADAIALARSGGGGPYREPPPQPTVQELAARVDAIDLALAEASSKAECTAAALEGVLQTIAVIQAESETVRYRKALGRIARGCTSAAEAEVIARAALEGR